MSQISADRNAKLKWILPILFIALAIAVFVLLKMSKPQAPSRPVQEKVWSVNTQVAEPSNHQPTLTLYGKIEAPRMSSLTAAVTAFVATVDIDEGSNIKKDQLLAQLDNRDAKLVVAQREADVSNYQAQLAAEKIRFESDEKTLQIQKNLVHLSGKAVKRYENLIKRKVASQDKLDSARRDYQQQVLSLTQREQAIADHPNRINQIESQLHRAIAQLDSAKLDLSRTDIRAPFDGRIASLSIAPGDRVRSGDPMLSLYSYERLEVRAQIPNRILPLFRGKADLNNISASGLLDGQIIKLQLNRVAAEVNSGNAGIDAFFRLTDTEQIPEPGRSLSIKLNLPPTADSIAIPPMALYGLNRIYKIVDNRLVAVEVDRIGDTQLSDGQPAVLIRTTDIKAGDLILTTQLPNAITGLRVKEAGKDA